MLYSLVFISIVIGASNSKQDFHGTQVSSDEVKKLVNCKTSQVYPDLSNLTFNPRSVEEDDTACLSLRMFTEMGFVSHFNISIDTLARFILRAKKGYKALPYHNWSHGFAVLHFSFAIQKQCQLIEKRHLKPIEGLALLTAAMCHDIDHRGTNNKFQLEVNSSLANRYGAQGSIMERHHIAVTLGFLKNPETNFVGNFKGDELKYFRDLIKQMILATDLAIHFKQLPDEKQMAAEGFDPLNDHHRQLLRSVIISCADLSDQTKDWATLRAVAKLVITEFFNQGDREKQLGLEPTKMMDSSQAKIPQLQIDFLNHVVIPDYQVLLSLYPEVQTCVDNIQQNLLYWRKTVLYFEQQQNQGRQQLDILSDNKLDYISTWT